MSRAASWIIRNIETKQVIVETFRRDVVETIDTTKFEAVPILEYLQQLNAQIKAQS